MLVTVCDCISAVTHSKVARYTVPDVADEQQTGPSSTAWGTAFN